MAFKLVGRLVRAATAVNGTELDFAAPIATFDDGLAFLKDESRQVIAAQTPIDLVNAFLSHLIVEAPLTFSTEQERGGRI